MEQLRTNRTIVGRAKPAPTVSNTYLATDQIGFGSNTDSVSGCNNFTYNPISYTAEISASGKYSTWSNIASQIVNGNNSLTLTATSAVISGGSQSTTITDGNVTVTNGIIISSLSDSAVTVINGSEGVTVTAGAVQISGSTGYNTLGNLVGTWLNGTSTTQVSPSSITVSGGTLGGTSSLIDSGGDITLKQTNSNTIQILTTDLTALGVTGKTIKLQPIGVCNTSLGTIYQLIVLGG